ncbi:histone methyltransferase set2 [Linnemannia gamsii]|uniref:[histone H3]-lysine(36) N-trimethyltransferase n=1 Tax=Linnemannia gamsii TaxID=64522 RepID=A0ABQ7K592_9FUNG|nr:histone methyltransferase set2 [Linnemannia gamsii]
MTGNTASTAQTDTSNTSILDSLRFPQAPVLDLPPLIHMLPSLFKDDSVMENGRVTQHRMSGSADSSVGPSSTNSSTSTSPSSSISDAMMTIEHAKETGFSSIIPELKQDEPEICASLASLHAPFSDPGTPTKATPSNSPPQAGCHSPKLEKLEISSPIPLSRLFDFDKEDQSSDKIVLNESERQYQQKLKDEFDAGFNDIQDEERNGFDSSDRPDSFSRPRSRRIVYDSDDEEVHVDDDEDEDDRRLYRSKHSVPPPPPPPLGPPPIKNLPSAMSDAQSTYQQMEHNIYRGANTGNSPVDDCLPCQCKYNPNRDPRWKACGPDCINRNLLVECIEDDCPCGSYCLNRRFQMKQNADVDVVKTEKKGFGLRAMEGLPAGSFVMEYIGEVLPHASFVKRTREYSLAGVEHFYFMSLQSDEVIDATKKGCLARFINHSCNPNCHLEKWVVGSKLRIGIFTIKRVAEGEELTFDYQFERYGAEAQKCYCGEFNCSGFIGGNKRSSATRLDDYNHLDEVEDEDEIDLENQMSLRHPKKDKVHDGDYEEEVEEQRVTRGIEDPILMEKLARIMFMKPKVEKSKRLLAKLMATTERACLRRFLVLHGLVILKTWLKHYKDEPDIIMGIMFVLPSIPLLSRNAIEDSLIEEAVQEVADGPDCPSKGMAQEVLEQWKELKPTYRIPKAKKQAIIASTTTDAASTPVDEPSTFMSPAESNGSGSGEGLGKRQYDDEERASTPAGMEKRGRFDGHDQTPLDETDTSASASASATPQDPPSRYHNYPFDSPEYTSRSESHRGLEHYGRISDGYGRLDMYGRVEPHSREGSYGRPGDSGYGRSESYGRIDPYGMSKNGYERGRYEHYRSDRDRERDRYYEYYRERDYDREYRSHRDLRDHTYNKPPPSPRRRDRDGSPGAPPRRELSPSPVAQQGMWSKEESRPTSPPKEGLAQSLAFGIATQVDVSQAIPAGPRVSETLPEQTAMSATGNISTPTGASTPSTTPPVATAIAAVQSAVLREDTVIRSPSAAASRNNSPPTQAAPTPLRNYSLPADPQSTVSASASASTDHSTAVTLGPSSTPQNNGYHYRSNSGHGDYPHSRYGGHIGGYSSSQYYRHSSNYPSYSKSHYYRSSSSRPYSSSASYPTSVELPPNWSKASDPEGRIYYYNEITRATQWEPPSVESPAEVLPEITPTAPISHYGPTTSTHSYHRTPQSHQQQPLPAARALSPEPPKPVNIDGFTQEQLQEVIGRAYDKQKQKQLANGTGSAGASVHDVDSPNARVTNPHSPSAMRSNSSGKPLKPMTEKDLKAALSANVVKNMAKYKAKLGSSEAFKKHARRITHLIADKEMRSKTFKAGELTEVTQGIKNKVRRFIKEYMTKLFKKLPKEERSSSGSAAAPHLNGSKPTQSHTLGQGEDGLPAVYLGSSVPNKEQDSTLTGKKPIKAGGDKKSMGYGDVEVDDDDDVKYGEGDDGDEEGDLEPEEDDDGGVAAVPSSSVELPL